MTNWEEGSSKQKKRRKGIKETCVYVTNFLSLLWVVENGRVFRDLKVLKWLKVIYNQ